MKRKAMGLTEGIDLYSGEKEAKWIAFIAAAVGIFELESSSLPTVPQMEAVASVGIHMKRNAATIALTSTSLCDNHEALASSR
jgi:hypothetical protein